jgi:hypothetical protein
VACDVRASLQESRTSLQESRGSLQEAQRRQHQHITDKPLTFDSAWAVAAPAGQLQVKAELMAWATDWAEAWALPAAAAAAAAAAAGDDESSGLVSSAGSMQWCDQQATAPGATEYDLLSAKQLAILQRMLITSMCHMQCISACDHTGSLLIGSHQAAHPYLQRQPQQ